VTTAASSGEAFEIIDKDKPAILISDIGMPDEDGYELIRKVRALPAGRGGDIPAIALTAYARTEDRMRVLRAGYQMHVPKPVEFAELIAIIASLIRRSG
jgi:CheY-like chemotaxis protein